jgi:hypothetical protein
MANLVIINILGHLRFMAAGLKLPTSASWQQPSGNPGGPHYGRSLQVSNGMVGVPTCIIPMFVPQNPQKYHQQSCDTVGQAFKDFIDNMLDAVAFAHMTWKRTAKFSSLKIAAVSAIGLPGCFGGSGPSFTNLIKYAPTAATMGGQMATWRDAVASGVGGCFSDYVDMVTVPGLPWYPAFAAFPGPQAPPMPNVPMPLIACISPMALKLVTPSLMSGAMGGAHSGGLKSKDPDSQWSACFDAIETPLNLAFGIWLVAQQVMQVMGKGPIPTFAPPFVPVGPVVAGDNIATPGHVAT